MHSIKTRDIRPEIAGTLSRRLNIYSWRDIYGISLTEWGIPKREIKGVTTPTKEVGCHLTHLIGEANKTHPIPPGDVCIVHSIHGIPTITDHTNNSRKIYAQVA